MDADSDDATKSSNDLGICMQGTDHTSILYTVYFPHWPSIVTRLDVHCLEPLERLHRHVGDERVELVGRVFVLVAPAGQPHADTEGNAPAETREVVARNKSTCASFAVRILS